MLTLSLYLVCGAAAGFLAGLLGLGGGLVVVPLLQVIFSTGGAVPEELSLHLAVGTSLSCIMFTAVASARAHARRGAVLWPLVRGIAPAIALGTLLGSAAAAALSAVGLKIFFVCFLVVVAVQMLGDFYPPVRGDGRPGRAILAGAGLVIGGVSSLVGLGGGTLSVPFLRWCGVDMRQAVGTSAAIGWAIAAAGSLGFAAHGWGVPGLPPYCLGYISLPATLGVAAASIFFAPLGARLSHALPVSTLRKCFAIILCAVAARLAWTLLA
ncbi:MAG: sulfite exporter TauE/SafE family protein [Candidatus Adiutrix sp.]|nr:sulfite exporter TauE/SafE family protein [Candidatus Adiutrix sp.]